MTNLGLVKTFEMTSSLLLDRLICQLILALATILHASHTSDAFSGLASHRANSYKATTLQL